MGQSSPRFIFPALFQLNLLFTASTAGCQACTCATSYLCDVWDTQPFHTRSATRLTHFHPIHHAILRFGFQKLGVKILDAVLHVLEGCCFCIATVPMHSVADCMRVGFLIPPGRNRMKSNSLLQCCKLAGWLSRKDNNFRSETFGRGTGPGQHQNRLKIQDLAKEWENFTSSEKDVVESIENCRTKQPKSSQQALFAASCREARACMHAHTHTNTHGNH